MPPVPPQDPFASYDALADLSAAAGPPQGRIAPLAAEVSADLKRRGRWRVGAPPEDESDRSSSARTARLTLLVIALWLAVMAGATLIVSWIMGLAFLGVSLPAIALEIHRRRSDRARRARTGLPICPHCGYDLAGLDDALPPAWVVGSSGPRRCPECGTAWPLVPREPSESV